MALMTRLRNRARHWLGVEQLAAAQNSQWWWPFAGMTSKASSGVNVTPDSAMQLATVFACVRVLSESLAVLPLILYQRRGNFKERATSAPLYRVLHARPNRWQTAQEFWEMAVGHVCLRGNFYAHILPGVRGAVDQLIPLNPDKMHKIELLTDGTLRYTYINDQGKPEAYLQDELLHVRGLSQDGFLGMSPITAARNAIGLAIATENHGATLFKNGARPGVVFERSVALKDDAVDKFRQSWDQVHGGPEGAHKTAVLPLGLKPAELGLSNEDAQFLDTRKYQRTEICGVFRVPPHKIGDLDRATFSNIEEQNIAFVQESLMPWARRIEQAVARDLIGEDDDSLFCEFLFEGLLRGNAASRAEFYRALWDMGVLSANDICEMENRNPIGPDGDKRFVQLNLTTLEKAGEEPAEPAKPTDPVAQPDEPSDDTGDLQLAGIIQSAELAMRQESRRLNRWEADAVNRLAKDATGFLPAINEFYAAHLPRSVERLAALANVVRKAGKELNIEAMLEGVLDARQNDVLEVAGNSTADTLRANIEALTKSWFKENGDGDE